MSTVKAGTPRPRNAGATRAAILEAATKRFTVLGYDRTTTRDIAADAGANVSLIARYFGSKEGLFAEVLHESTDALQKLRSGDYTNSSVGLADSIVDGMHPERWPEFGGEHPLLLLISGTDDDKSRELRRRSLDDLAAFLGERVAQSGEERGDLGDPPLRGDLLLALVIGMLTVRSVRPHGALANANEAQLRSVAEQLVTTLAAIV